MKAQKMRNIILFYFPLVVNCVGDNYPAEQSIWLLLSYMIRACIIPNDEFKLLDVRAISRCAEQFYQTYESVHGTQQCTYSIHVVASHILQIRGKDPLTFKSAFKFENFYGEIKYCFQPGTPSTLKQIMKNIIMKRSIEHHVCESTIFFSPKTKKKNKECNNLIYTYVKDQYAFYDIINVQGDVLSCIQYGIYPVQYPQVPSLSWSKVGIFRLGPSDSVPCLIHSDNVKGKALKIDKYIITCPNNVLREK